MLQIGDVDFDTAAGDDYNFVFDGVAEPADVVHMVDQATRRAPPTGLGDQPRRRAARSTACAGARRRVGSLAEPGGLAQRLGAVGPLPGEVVVVAAEVAVGGGLLEDRPVQAQLLAEGARAQVEVLVDQAPRSPRARSSRCRTSRPSPRPGGRRRSRRRPGPRSGRRGRRRRRSWPPSGPRRRPSGRPSTGPCPRTRRRRGGPCRRRCRR